ncbi:MAG: prepilin-type N-terminal cleavage/methylation domain-containing protein [Magnetococcales bacterium]|nr:prepilin-type N-terminal cleavage/methylation domain-containing protein [Magnetococcales bacterium]
MYHQTRQWLHHLHLCAHPALMTIAAHPLRIQQPDVIPVLPDIDRPRSSDPVPPNHEKGFTLMEVIMVIVVIGLVSNSILKLFPDHLIRVSSTRNLVSDLRKAQTLSMNQGGGFRILSTAANSYEIRDATGATVTGTTVTTDGIIFSSFNTQFDRFGSPTGSGSITVTDSFGTSTVTVSANTGYVNQS